MKNLELKKLESTLDRFIENVCKTQVEDLLESYAKYGFYGMKLNVLPINAYKKCLIQVELINYRNEDFNHIEDYYQKIINIIKNEN